LTFINICVIYSYLIVNRGGNGRSVSSIIDLLLQVGGSRSTALDTKELNGERTDNVEVDDSATTVLGKTNVKEKDGLEQPVEGDPVEDGLAPKLNNAEGSVNNPVGEEMGVVFESLGLKSN
jgi:hypothetical protein